jgi:AraC-like DNA-binding protein
VSLVYRSASLPGLEALSCRTGFSFEAHMHSGSVLWLNSSGGERFSVRGSSEVLQPGCLSLIEAGVVHANQPCGSGPRDLRSLYLEDSLFIDLARRFELPSLRLPQCTRIFADAWLWRGTAALHQAIMNNAETMVVEQQTLQVFARLFDRCRLLPGMARETKSNDSGLRRMIDFIREQHRERVTLEDLAGVGRCSEMHVLRQFKAGLGMTPHRYLTQVRLEQARRLIAAGLPLADAALQAGFADQSHLTRNFRQRFGVTPATYRRQRNAT